MKKETWKNGIRYIAITLMVVIVSLSIGLTGALGLRILGYKNRGFETKEAAEWAIDDMQDILGIKHVPKSIRDAMDDFGWEYTVNKNVAIVPCVDLWKGR